MGGGKCEVQVWVEGVSGGRKEVGEEGEDKN